VLAVVLFSLVRSWLLTSYYVACTFSFTAVLVQDKQNGRVISVIDNRSALMAQRMAGGSAEGQKAFSDLLKGGGSK